MKTIRLLLTLILTMISYTTAMAQYTNENSLSRKAIIVYQKDKNGMYVPYENSLVTSVQDVKFIYAYNKKTHDFYVRTDNGNYVITPTKDYTKLIKKNKDVPHLDNEEIASLVSLINADLEKKFSTINDSIKAERKRIREKEIADSIRAVREQERKAEEERKERQRKLEEERDLENKKKIYAAEHDWTSVPTAYVTLHCSLCDKSIATDSIHCAAIKNDSIYYYTFATGYYDDIYPLFHVSEIPHRLKNNDDFKFHCSIYADSLYNNKFDWSENTIIKLNYHSIEKHKRDVRKEAPYGYVMDWGWDSDYGYISNFYFEYCNLNTKTIKYIDVYWVAYNDVNDIRGRGNFKGVGPVKPGASASWNWDSYSYRVSYDATTMKWYKIIITYMNGKQQILNKNMIKFCTKDDDDDSESTFDDGMKEESGTYISRIPMTFPKSSENTESYKLYDDEDENTFGTKYHSHNSYNNSPKEPEAVDNALVEVQATYPGGEAALLSFVSKNLVYPAIAQEQELQGTVVLRFIVGTDGSVSNIKIEKSLSRECDQSAANVVKKLHRFVPAKQDGHPVPVWYRLPIRFRIQ